MRLVEMTVIAPGICSLMRRYSVLRIAVGSLFFVGDFARSRATVQVDPIQRHGE